MEPNDTPPLFDDVVCTIIHSQNLEEEDREVLIQAIQANGGRFVPLRDTDQEIEDISSLTHIISTHVDFPQFKESIRRGIYVVKPSWVAHSIQKQKLCAPRQYSPDPSQFFHDVVLTCGHLPANDTDNIIAGVLAFGGQYSGALTKLVTHIVTTDLDHAKCKLAESRGLQCLIMLPHWFDDCLKLGKKISERPYQFPNPQYLLQRDQAIVRSGPTPKLDGATTAEPKGLPQLTPTLSPSNNRKNLNAFTSKKVFLCADLHMNDHLHQTIEGLIDYAGGVVVDDAEQCDIYVGHYRAGADYVTASQNGKCVANLSWLFHVINRNCYTDPQSKLLHYPVPPNGITGFENMKISISNYSGDARVYVENLIRYCGAEFTKTMKQDNTHLITAHGTSEKCEAAQEWNINMVNHLWLEESYAKCTVQTLANPKYTHFPTRTNLGEVAGQTGLDMRNVERLYFPSVKKSPQKFRGSPKSRSAQAVSLGCDKDPEPLHHVEQTENNDMTHTITSDDRDTGTEEQSAATVKRKPGRPPKAIATPRARDEEKENESPLPASTGRASKLKAVNTLRTQAEDIALYQKEVKRKGGVTHGGRRHSQSGDVSSPAPARQTSKKRPSDEYDIAADGSGLSDGETQEQPAPQAKKAKVESSSIPPIKHRLIVTGDTRWVDNTNKESTDRSKLRQLGVLLVTEPRDVDILVAPKLLRTKKFVMALAWAPIVVDTGCLDVALNQKVFATSKSLLVDRESEERYGFTLAESLERARTNRRRLFRGWTIFISKDVAGGFDTYKDIITCNGGTAVLYQGRTGFNMSKRVQHDPEAGPEVENQGVESEFDYVYLVSGTGDAEVKNWRKFRDTAEKQGLKVRITATEWLLRAAMSQHIEWKQEWEHEDSLEGTRQTT